METYKYIPCNRIITKSNKINHEKTEFHINNSSRLLSTTLLSYKTCISCKRVQENTNFYNGKNKCKNCLNEYKRERIECKICNIITTRNYYYNHIKIHKELPLPIIGKICTKCKIDKPKDSFHNDKNKKDGKKTICKECVKVSNDEGLKSNGLKQSFNLSLDVKESSNSPDQNSNIKHIIDINHIECISYNKIISKTNWSKHEKTIKHSNSVLHLNTFGENVKTLSSQEF
jgi:hypothetical protein